MLATEKDSVAIIMRSKNEMPYIERSLSALKRQSFTHFTLYCVDSGSQDGSGDIARCYTDHFIEIKPEEYRPGPVLNMMIAHSKEPLIVLLNADAIPCSIDWLENMVRPIIENQADATFCRQIPRQDARFLVRYDYERAFDPRKIEPFFFSAVACAFRRVLWERHHFYEKGYSEDIAWAKTAREDEARICFLPEVQVEHSHNYTLEEIYRRGFIEGEAEYYIFKKRPSIIFEGYLCLKEIVRDFFYTLGKGRIWLIPYHILARLVKHAGFYAGKRQGGKRSGHI
jgi:rhamnosyltransferase